MEVPNKLCVLVNILGTLCLLFSLHPQTETEKTVKLLKTFVVDNQFERLLFGLYLL